jgi:hypothetical protein
MDDRSDRTRPARSMVSFPTFAANFGGMRRGARVRSSFFFSRACGRLFAFFDRHVWPRMCKLAAEGPLPLALALVFFTALPDCRQTVQVV